MKQTEKKVLNVVESNLQFKQAVCPLPSRQNEVKPGCEKKACNPVGIYSEQLFCEEVVQV